MIEWPPQAFAEASAERNSLFPVETCTIPSDPASANPRNAASKVSEEVTFTPGNAERALLHFTGLLAPGGTLAVIGLARSSLRDLPIDMAATVPNQFRRRRAPYWQHPSPTVWPPPETYASMQRIAARVLPAARFQRRLYWRYTLAWRKPADSGTPRRSAAPLSSRHGPLGTRHRGPAPRGTEG